MSNELQPPQLAFDRRVSSELEAALSPDGCLHPLVDIALADPRVDIQLRRNGRISSVSFYCGLTSILDVLENHGTLSFKAHLTHRAAGGFEAEWSSAARIERTATQIAGVTDYVLRMLAPGGVGSRYTGREGALQASIVRQVSDDFGVFEREAVPSFPSVASRAQVVDPVANRIWSAVEGAFRAAEVVARRAGPRKEGSVPASRPISWASTTTTDCWSSRSSRAMS